MYKKEEIYLSTEFTGKIFFLFLGSENNENEDREYETGQ